MGTLFLFAQFSHPSRKHFRSSIAHDGAFIDQASSLGKYTWGSPMVNSKTNDPFSLVTTNSSFQRGMHTILSIS